MGRWDMVGQWYRVGTLPYLGCGIYRLQLAASRFPYRLCLKSRQPRREKGKQLLILERIGSRRALISTHARSGHCQFAGSKFKVDASTVRTQSYGDRQHDPFARWIQARPHRVSSPETDLWLAILQCSRLDAIFHHWPGKKSTLEHIKRNDRTDAA